MRYLNVIFNLSIFATCDQLYDSNVFHNYFAASAEPVQNARSILIACLPVLADNVNSVKSMTDHSEFWHSIP